MDASLQLRAEQLATEFASQARTAEDLNSLMRLMMKSALERMLNTELDVHLGRRSLPHSRSPLLRPSLLHRRSCGHVTSGRTPASPWPKWDVPFAVAWTLSVSTS